MADDARRSRAFLLALALLLIALAVWIAWPLKTAVVLALLVGYLLRPVYAWLVARVKRPWIASVLIVLGVLAAIIVPTGYLGYRIVQEAQDLAGEMRSGAPLQQQAVTALRDAGVGNATAERVVERAGSALASFAQGLAGTLVSAIGFLTIAIIVFFVLLYFVVKDGDRFARFVRRNLPLTHARSERLLARTGESVKAIVLGVFVVAIVQGALAAAGWWALGLPRPVFWGFAMMIAEFVPFLGAFVILLPAAVWAFLQGNLFAAGGLLVLNFLIVGLVDNFIRPFLIGGRAHVHPGIVLVGLAGGVLTFGASGLVLGPLVLALTGPVIEAWAHPDETPLARDDGNDDA